MNAQQDEEIYRVGSGRVLKTGAFVPKELECATLPACGCINLPLNYPDPLFGGFLWKLHRVGMINHKLNLHRSPLPEG